MGNYCEQVVHSRYVQLGLQPMAGQRATVAGPTRREGPPGQSPAVGTYEGWVTGPTAPGPATDDWPWSGVPAGHNGCERLVHRNFP